MTYRSLLKCFSLLLLFVQAASAQTKHTFALGDKDFLLDGRPFQMISGEMHCERIPRAYWRDRIRMAKAMGLNTIGTYVFWNAHEVAPGKYIFSGNNDVKEFVKIAQEEGMWVVMRPSPYVCAEWEFGGYPWWLLKDSTVKVRSNDPRFVDAYRKYLNQVAKQLVPQLVTHGGNILMVQIENEYGSYGNDKQYLDLNRKIFRAAGFDGVLFTCDGADKMEAGYLPGYLPAVNGLEDTAQVKTLINKYHDGKGPYYIAEWYPGWFDHWGERHNTTSADNNASKLDEILKAGISVNMYMFHGGTTRDFMNGANMNVKEPYAPQVSSYDYDAPLDESGNATLKYYKFRDVITKHLPQGHQLPPVPDKKKTIAINRIALSAYAGLFSNLPKPVASTRPLTFEDLDQGYGFVLYRTRLSTQKGGWLKLMHLRDYAQIFINGKRVGVLDRRLYQDSIKLDDVPKNATLDILVENNGRINYGPYLADNRHGITQKVTLNNAGLAGWQMFRLPYSDLKAVKYAPQQGNNTPGFYKGVFMLKDVGDTYLDMRSFGKGFVYLNGHNLGKYWNIGPQQTIYIPAVWLKKGKNELVVFDQLKGGHTRIQTIETTILNQQQTAKK
jgi:beta-galactosidase